MHHVLMPVDSHEDRAREQAQFVVELTEASSDVVATIAHSFEGENEDLSAAMRTPRRVGAVKTAIEILDEAGIETNVSEIGSPPKDGILRLADQRDVDQIVVSGRHSDPVGKAIFGSTAQAVVLNAQRPVTVVGRQGGQPPK